jgi:hypothetical protein
MNKNGSNFLSINMLKADNLINSLLLLGSRVFERAAFLFVFIVHCQLGMPINLQLLVQYLLAGLVPSKLGEIYLALLISERRDSKGAGLFCRSRGSSADEPKGICHAS